MRRELESYARCRCLSRKHRGSAPEQGREDLDAAIHDVGLRAGEADAHVRRVGAEAGPRGQEQPAFRAILEKPQQPALVEPVRHVEEQERAARGRVHAQPPGGATSHVVVLLPDPVDPPVLLPLVLPPLVAPVEPVPSVAVTPVVPVGSVVPVAPVVPAVPVVAPVFPLPVLPVEPPVLALDALELPVVLLAVAELVSVTVLVSVDGSKSSEQPNDRMAMVLTVAILTRMRFSSGGWCTTAREESRRALPDHRKLQ